MTSLLAYVRTGPQLMAMTDSELRSTDRETGHARAAQARTDRRCIYCGDLATAQDHVWPRSRGGDDHPNNLVPACTPCNSSKGAKSVLDDCCPGCSATLSPGDVDTAKEIAFYACRCGTAWRCWWSLSLAASMTIPSAP